jgi:hypothetical protein
VSLRANPCIARLSARFSIRCCENPFTLKDTQENAHDANQRIEPHRTSIRYYGKKIAGRAAER